MTTGAMNMTIARTGGRSLILLTMCLGVLVAQIDTSVVNLALKHISADLTANVSQLQWVVDSYNLTYATLLLTGGVRPIFMAAAAYSPSASRSSPSAR
jgi:MFS family permease